MNRAIKEMKTYFAIQVEGQSCQNEEEEYDDGYSSHQHEGPMGCWEFEVSRDSESTVPWEIPKKYYEYLCFKIRTEILGKAY